MNRRTFLATTGCLGVSLALGADSRPARKPPIKLGLCTYSYWHFRDPKLSVETVIDKAADLGVAGVDVLHRQMDIPEREPLTDSHRAYLQKLKRQGFRNGVNLICLSTHQTFLSPDAAKIAGEVEHTEKCIEICYDLGIPCLRINTGRWATIEDFDELMKKRGIEPILPGHNEEEGYKWVIDGIQRCLARAEKCGVMLALENHWGLARTPEGQLRILNSIPSPWLGALMDTGNFLEDPYDKLKLIAPKTVYVQAKTYYGGGGRDTPPPQFHNTPQNLFPPRYTGCVAPVHERKKEPPPPAPQKSTLLSQHLNSFQLPPPPPPHGSLSP